MSAVIKELDFRVTSIRQLVNPPIVNNFRREDSSSRAKVAEIINTGRMEKLEELKMDPRVVALKDLTTVWGVGPTNVRSGWAGVSGRWTNERRNE